MKKSLALIFGVVVALMMAPSANAAISQVFQNTGTPLNCALDGTYSYCGNPVNVPASPTSVASFDGTPLDVVVALPGDAAAIDGPYPIVGMFHGWGGNKINLKTDPTAQALLAQGFIVFSMTDRGWSGSCGGPSVPIDNSTKAWPCTQGYIHLMHNAYEVRDAQYLFGLLADDRNDADSSDIINPTQIGAMGGSYGGAISAQLAMLKNRIQLPNGQLVAWKSPAGKSMAVAGAAPQYTWSDLAASLAPNGSTLDYTTNNPYYGVNSDHRDGITKQQWVFSLYASGAQAGYYSPSGLSGAQTGYPDPAANITGWYKTLGLGNPFSPPPLAGMPTVSSITSEVTNNHSAYYIPIDNISQQPAPMLISSGWNDDLFPVTEGVRLYNHVRTTAPTTPVQIWGIDIGHTPRSNTDSASRTADATALIGQQVTWMVKYVKGIGAAPLPVPAPAVGGAIATSSKCGTGGSAQTRVAGVLTPGANWASLSQGQVTVLGNAEQTIEPGTAPADQFVGSSTDVCDYAGRTDVPDGAALYTDTVGTGGFTLLGTPTIEADFNVTGQNDQIIARLYDYDPAGIGHERLISRGVYRPMNVGGGSTRQVFQLMPQNYEFEAGHTIKLELLSSDSPFSMNSKGIQQQPIEVENLRLALPTKDANGAAGGQVTRVLPRKLPTGADFTEDALATDTFEPVSTNDVPATLQKSVTVTLDAVDTGISGVEAIYYTTDGSTPTTSSSVYNENAKPTLANGEVIKYFAVDRAGNDEAVQTSIPAQVDSTPPAMPTLVSGPSGTVNTPGVSIAFSGPEMGGSMACSLDGAPSFACSSPWLLNDTSVGDHTARIYSIDSVGNVSDPLVVTWKFQGVMSLSVKIDGTAKIGKTITAKPTAKYNTTTLSSVTYRYSWTANGKKISSKSKIKLSSKWKGKKIAVKVNASKSGYTNASATKTATSKLK